MAPQHAIGYVRISDDRDHESAGVTRQQEDVATLAQRLGWTVTEVIVENDTSAWKRRKVKLPDGSEAYRVLRPGFRRALDALMTGAADGFLAYDLDRVARDPRDLEDLIDVVVARKVPTQSFTGSLDLSTDSGILAARINVAVAHKSSADTSRRVRRKHEELATGGRYSGGGRRPFGYETDGVTVRQDEAAVITWMCARALDGTSLSGIARELDARGVRPVTGVAKWSARSVDSALGPRVAGLRTFRGEIVGPATWPAIVDRGTWEQVRASLAGRWRGRNGANTLIRWCTGLLWCHHCQQHLHAAHATGGVNSTTGARRRAYRCPDLHVAISPAEKVEDEIARQVLDFLSQPNVLARLRSTTAAPSVEQARRDIAADEAQLAELATAYGTKKITMAQWLDANAPIEKRIRDAKNVLSIAAPGTVRALVAGDVRAGWARLGPAGMREVASTVQPDGWRVDPLPPGARPRFNPARLVPLPAEEP